MSLGEMLTADVSGIADADGLSNAVYQFQWLVSDGHANLVLPVETGAEYTVLPIDIHLNIMVRVMVTDDFGNRETRTSAPTARVVR